MSNNISNAQRTANNKYLSRHTKSILVTFYPKDNSLFEFVNSKENSSHYIRQLIHEEMLRQSKPGETPREHTIASPCPVRCVETGEVFPSQVAAARAVGAKRSTNINAALRGRAKTAAGYHWEYVDETGENSTKND